jgi:predicted transcriptional regulator
MTTQKEHIEKLETDVHEIKESMQRLEQSMKETIAAALKEAVASASTEMEAKTRL